MTLQNNTTRNGNGLSGLTYLLIGGGIGAALALLFAPKSGTELRHDIADVTKKGYDGTLDMARRVKDESSSIYNSVLDRSKDVLDTATDKAMNAVDSISGAIEHLGDDVTSIDTARSGNGGRRASKII